MRVNVVAEDKAVEEVAGALRGYLIAGGFGVGDARSDYTVRFSYSPSEAHLVVDGIDCPLEQFIVGAIGREPLVQRVVIQFEGGVQSDIEIRIGIPASWALREAAAKGAWKGFNQYIHSLGESKRPNQAGSILTRPIQLPSIFRRSK